MRLGLKGPKADAQGRTLKLSDVLADGIAVPAAFDPRIGIKPDRATLGNLKYGCCMPAGLGHSIILNDTLWEIPTQVTEAGVLTAYTGITTAEGVAPFDPDDQATDNGCYALDGMKYFRKTGVCNQRILAYTAVNFMDANELAKASFVLNCGLAFAMPNSAQGADVWDSVADDGGAWGGHFVQAVAPCPGGVVVKSWGADYFVTDMFIARYCFEGWAWLNPNAVGPRGLAYAGVDLDKMQTALLAIEAA